MNELNLLVEKVVVIARQAGDAAMEVYNSDDFEVEMKGDQSPLTKADKKANDIITVGLQQAAQFPVVSEENEVRQIDNDTFWLVDPLDGTKEFIKRNGEFTINIALVKKGSPILGVVYAPVLDTLYVGDVTTKRAYKDRTGKRVSLASECKSKIPVIVTSRSHKDERTQALLDAIGKYQEVSMGSSLKLCLVAEGAAELYPRLAPTYLWDTAAADAVVRAAGGLVRDEAGYDLRYDPHHSLKNPYFIVTAGNCRIDWRKLFP